ncbi:hypothetical protein, partial [Salmonella enterica]|uniref:hypothetical protein n=1 Tax=Salmonella enterica TaxID=28901 RepID=UPI003EDBA9BB
RIERRIVKYPDPCQIQTVCAYTDVPRLNYFGLAEVMGRCSLNDANCGISGLRPLEQPRQEAHSFLRIFLAKMSGIIK